MFNTLTGLLGRRIDDAQIISFIETNGFKYPKKVTISNRSSDSSYWVENKKLGFDLLFKINTYLKDYPPIQGDKKGVFIPILSHVRFYNNKSKSTFPQGIDFDHNFDTLQAKLGAPTLKSSEITPTWLNDDGSESFYRWKVPLVAEKSIVWGVEYGDDQSINNISLELQYAMPVFELYYEYLYGTYETFMKSKSHYITADLMFLRWAIERDLIKTDATTAPVVRDIKDGKLPVTEWIRVLGRGYIQEEDFASDRAFVHAYIKNLSGHDVLYGQDFAFTLLTDPQEKNNYFGAAATKSLNEIGFNEENYAAIKAMLDMRLAEYREHKFSKSRKELV